VHCDRDALVSGGSVSPREIDQLADLSVVRRTDRGAGGGAQLAASTGGDKGAQASAEPDILAAGVRQITRWLRVKPALTPDFVTVLESLDKMRSDGQRDRQMAGQGVAALNPDIPAAQVTTRQAVSSASLIPRVLGVAVRGAVSAHRRLKTGQGVARISDSRRSRSGVMQSAMRQRLA